MNIFEENKDIAVGVGIILGIIIFYSTENIILAVATFIAATIITLIFKKYVE